jgi:hypothetical protein
VQKVPVPLLSPQTPIPTRIRVRHNPGNILTRYTVIINSRKQNHRTGSVALNPSGSRNPLSMIDGQGRPETCRRIFLDQRMGCKKIHQKSINTLGANAYGPSQIKIWLQRFRDGDTECRDLPQARRPPLTLGHRWRHFFKSTLLPWPA